MTERILVDTDVMVDYLRGYAEAVKFIKKYADHIILSSITVAELYVGVRDGPEREILDNVISLFRVVPVTAHIALAGGLLKRDFGKSHGVGLADAIIAATAQSENAKLCTLNAKHYPMLAGIRPVYTKK